MRLLMISAAIALAISSNTYAQDIKSHEEHHPNAAAAAPVPTSPEVPAGGQAQTSPQAPETMMMANCPMISGNANQARKPEIGGPTAPMGMANGQMSCPMMQGQGGPMMQSQPMMSNQQPPAKGS